MSGALEEQGGKHDALEEKLAVSEKKLRAAEAAAERNAARAAASEQALKKEKDAELAEAKRAAAERSASEAREKDRTEEVAGAGSAAKAAQTHAEERSAALEERVHELEGVTPEDKELLGQLTRSEKRLRKALVAWKREKAEVHRLRLAAQRDETEMAQMRTLIAQQKQQL